MKVRLGDLRHLVREEFLRGVPEFALREATRKYVEEVRQHVQRHIAATKRTPVETREAIASANEVLHKFEEDANELLEGALWQYVQKG
jgi:hypothetical protein